MRSRVLAFIVVFSGVFNTPAMADNANPPKIVSVTELSKGPYLPGDVVSIKVEHTGGYPGISSYSTSWKLPDGERNCILRDSFLNPPFLINEFFGNGVLSWTVRNCKPGIYSIYQLKIRDATRLEAIVIYPFKFEIVDFPFRQVEKGEIAPTLLTQDALDLSHIPERPKPGETFFLPKYTVRGVPVYYGLPEDEEFGDVVCSIRKKFEYPVRPGGELTVNKKGICKLYVSSDTGRNPTYDQPYIKSRLKGRIIEKSGDELGRMVARSTFFAIPVGDSSGEENLKTITCIKGKSTKKVSGTNPKCPKGFKRT